LINLEKMKSKKEKTTILFVNRDSNTMKPLQVSNRLLSNWKKYLAAVLLIFFGLVGTVGYLISRNRDEVTASTNLARKLHTLHQALEQIDTSAIKERFSDIDKDLSKINAYLRERGIKPAVKGPEGGEADSDIISPEEITSFYEGYLNRLLFNLAYTPLGYPFAGTITSTFGHRENPFGGNNIETHKGVDISGPIGAPVKAMAKGEVEFAGRRGGFGNCIMIKHANGYETLYGHLSKILVHVGQKVDIGENIGKIGSTGRSTGPHLHYEVHKNGKQINPESFLTLN
jgi:murein DD-endopeptidase MepM/ murein hydrolase activator NlpD